jgi:outer membrane protein OmpA-like peptidoglycan-associated protein
VAVTEPSGEVKLIEQNTHQLFQWEPAVYFGFDSDQLTQFAMDRLDRSLVVVKQFPDLNIGLQGFADKFGNEAYNFDLTERRVATVKRYLIEQGVEPQKIISQPLGEGLPINGRGTKVENRVNRRVELQLLKQTGRPAVQFVSIEE